MAHPLLNVVADVRRRAVFMEKSSYWVSSFPHFCVIDFSRKPPLILQLTVLLYNSIIAACGIAFALFDFKTRRGFEYNTSRNIMGALKFTRQLELNEIVKYGTILYIVLAMLSVPAGLCSSQSMHLQFVPPISVPASLLERVDQPDDLSQYFIPFEGIVDHDVPEPVIDNPSINMPFYRPIMRASQAYNVEAALIRAIILAESNYNPLAVSRAGAQGLMQLMPSTARWLGVEDSFDPDLNIDGGVRYFKTLLDRFGGDVELALAAYNAGSRYVRYYGGVPPFRATRLYIQKVLKYTRIYRQEMTRWVDYS